MAPNGTMMCRGMECEDDTKWYNDVVRDMECEDDSSCAGFLN